MNRDLTSSSIFFREMDVVPPMTSREERELLELQDRHRFRMFQAIHSVRMGRRILVDNIRNILSGSGTDRKLLDGHHWGLQHSGPSPERREELEALMRRLGGRHISRATVQELHPSWHGVEQLGKEVFAGIDRCGRLLAKRGGLLSRLPGIDSVSLMKLALECDDLDLPISLIRTEARELYPAITAIANELDAVEVRIGSGIYDYSNARRSFRRAQDGLREIIERFVEANLGLVVNRVRRYYPCSIMEEMDLVQEGCQGLMEAVRRFDPSRGHKLSTYAVWWIRQYIMKALARYGRTVRLPANVQKTDSMVKSALDDFVHENGRAPSTMELAEFMGMECSELEDIYLRTAPSLSLDRSEPENDVTIADFLESRLQSPDAAAEQKDARERIMAALASLSEREKTIITLRFGLLDGESCTLQDVGRIFGISRERVRQIEARALKKLRNHGLISALDTKEEC